VLLDHNATASAVSAALNALSTIGGSNPVTSVSCTGGPIDTAPVVVTFHGGGDVPEMTSTPAAGMVIDSVSGSPAPFTDEVETVEVIGASAGTFTLDFQGETTDPIDWDATAADVQAALDGLSNIGSGKNQTATASVTGGPLSTSPVTVTFSGGGSVGPLTATLSKKLGAGVPQPKVFVNAIKVFGIATDDDYTCSDVVRHICSRLGVRDDFVQECGIPALPAHFVQAHGDVLALMCLMSGWHAFMFRSGEHMYLDFAPFSDTRWYATDPETFLDLLPQPRFNRLILEHKWEDGFTTGIVTVQADPDPLERTITAPVMKLDRPASRRRAQLIGQRLVNDLAKQRFTGTITTDRLRDRMGRPVAASQARAGDEIFVPNHGWLQVDSATRSDSSVMQFSIAGTEQMLDQYNALRTRVLS
jgi:hypothetical protein